jgi:hypothetical protein
MKKIKTKSKLQLNKETVAKLENEEMTNVQAGNAETYPTFVGNCTHNCTATDFCCTGSYDLPCKWTTVTC